MKKDYYDILGVKKDASPDELKKQYHKLSLQFHPDRQAGKSDAEKKAAEEKFKEISEAYAVLSDDEKRKKYDQFGNGGFNGEFDFGGAGFDPMEFFRQMHGGMGGFDFFENFNFGRRGGHSHSGMAAQAREDSSNDGANYETGISITFKESVFGCKKEIVLNVGEECPECHGTGCKKGTSPVKCPDCNGTGTMSRVMHTGMMIHRVVSTCPKCHGMGTTFDPCGRCGGSGRISKNRKVTVTIPAGVDNGVRLRLPGCGQCGVRGGHAGDAYVDIAAGSSPIFEREGIDIYFTAYVPAAVMALGGKVKVPTLYGYRDIKLEPGTQAGAKLRVADYGVKTQSGSGNMIITVIPELPAKMTSEQKKAWEKIVKLDKPEDYKMISVTNKLVKEFYS